jgi:hypothetical protein
MVPRFGKGSRSAHAYCATLPEDQKNGSKEMRLPMALSLPVTARLVASASLDWGS